MTEAASTTDVGELLVDYTAEDNPGDSHLQTNMSLSDASNSAYVYVGKNTDDIGLEEKYKSTLNLHKLAILCLSEPVKVRNSNVMADRWFFSVELRLICVRSLRKNKGEMLREFMPSKSREVEFSRGIYREWFLCSSACFLN
jgi:hypothetical protein